MVIRARTALVGASMFFAGLACWITLGQQSPSRVTTELREILAADQAEPPEPPGVPKDPVQREQFYRNYWNRNFKPRYDRVIQFISQGLLSSGEDYFIAGTIVNHSPDPNDNLIAHALFTAAAFRKHPQARWASAAALDGYLESMGKPQLFGTVYGGINGLQKDRSEVLGPPMTDALRREFCVPSLAKQTELLQLLRDGNRARFSREKVQCE